MARKKKDGRRAQGIQAKKGMLYIVVSRSGLNNGEKVFTKKWVATGLTDTPDNVNRAEEMRRAILSKGRDVLTTDYDVTMSEYVDLFLEKIKRSISDTTYSGYLYRGKRIKDFFGLTKIRSVTKNDVEQFLDHLITHCKNQERTVKDTKTFLNSVLDQAVKDTLIADNPATSATLNKRLLENNAKEKNDDDTFFSYQEAQYFLSISETHPLYELFYVALFFGLRREEVLGLRWSCINFKAKEFHISHTVTRGTTVNRLNRTKTRSSKRTYPLTDDQIKLFRHLKSEEEKNRKLFGRAYTDTEYVFKHQDGSLYYPDYPSKALKKIIKEHAELPQGVTFHKLRTSCVSILVHEGYDVKRIQKWVGHDDINTTLKIYAMVKDKESKAEIATSMETIIRPKTYTS